MLGDLSKYYEVGSNGYCGTISTGWGDAGGKSYGLYQLSSVAGSVTSFIWWLSNHNNEYHNRLVRYPVGSKSFDNEWKAIASENPEEFGRLQHDYIKRIYYDEAVEALREIYFNIEKHSEIMKDVIWSRAVQYGVGNIKEMFTDALRAMERKSGNEYPNLSYVDDKYFDAELIKAIYLDVCHTEAWTNGSPSLRRGLYARFESECDDALNALLEESLDY